MELKIFLYFFKVGFFEVVNVYVSISSLFDSFIARNNLVDALLGDLRVVASVEFLSENIISSLL
jgi:hypothetical protein